MDGGRDVGEGSRGGPSCAGDCGSELGTKSARPGNGPPVRGRFERGHRLALVAADDRARFSGVRHESRLPSVGLVAVRWNRVRVPGCRRSASWRFAGVGSESPAVGLHRRLVRPSGASVDGRYRSAWTGPKDRAWGNVGWRLPSPCRRMRPQRLRCCCGRRCVSRSISSPSSPSARRDQPARSHRASAPVRGLPVRGDSNAREHACTHRSARRGR